MRRSALALLAFFWLGTGASLADAAETPPMTPPAAAALAREPCRDVLAALGVSPPGLSFAGCEYTIIHGLKALRVRYVAPGGRAAAVEAKLKATTGMPRLRYLCCGWEPAPAKPGAPPFGSISMRGERYEVRMTSGENVVTDRKRWAEIPEFSVDLVRYLEEP